MQPGQFVLAPLPINLSVSEFVFMYVKLWQRGEVVLLSIFVLKWRFYGRFNGFLLIQVPIDSPIISDYFMDGLGSFGDITPRFSSPWLC